MPIADPAQFAEMLDCAKQKRFAYPSVNVTSSETLNAAPRGFADADSDSYLRPLLDKSAAHLAASSRSLFTSHTWDGSTLPLDQNLDVAGELLGLCRSAQAGSTVAGVAARTRTGGRVRPRPPERLEDQMVFR